MRKVYKQLTVDQKARGVIFSSELKGGNTIHENIYTPLLNSKNGKRLKFDLEKDVQVIYGSLDVRKKGLKAIITIGHITPYAVYGTDCGLENCNCDAFIKLIK